MTLFTAEVLLRTAHRASLKGIGGALNKIAYHSYLRWLYTQGIQWDADEAGRSRNDLINGWLVKQKALSVRQIYINCMHMVKNISQIARTSI
jgi:hypothetical protein